MLSGISETVFNGGRDLSGLLVISRATSIVRSTSRSWLPPRKHAC